MQICLSFFCYKKMRHIQPYYSFVDIFLPCPMRYFQLLYEEKLFLQPKRKIFQAQKKYALILPKIVMYNNFIIHQGYTYMVAYCSLEVCLLLTARLLTSHWTFPYWEQLLPLMLAIATFNGNRIFIKWLLLMDKCHFFHPLPLKFRNAFK